MDALTLLKEDHDTVRSMFEQFRTAAESGDESRIEDLAGQIFHELEVHTEIEERIFYPAVRDAGGGELDDLTDESNEEHHVVDLLIAEVKGMSPSDDRFKAKMTVMMENVEHHASEEEDEMFPKVRELMDESRLQELGDRLQQEKKKLEAESKSRDELYEKAKARGVEGRSDMTKDELAEAVGDAASD